MNPSVMVLVKNEAYFLPYVLAQTVGYFQSYVIYDVGSTDNTKDIIQWFVKTMEGKAELFVRYLPHVPKEAQGAFRNSMIVEGRRPIYFILDGDELYTQADLAKISVYANDLLWNRDHVSDQLWRSYGSRKKFGVFKRVEVNADMTQRYNRERSHHRLYTQDAFWTGTHPGEVSAYKQNEESEIYYPVKCWHFHNTERSPQESAALGRLERKMKKTYHPDDEGTSPVDLLAELPILQKPIENFPVSPALARLQKAKR
jgi:glycosyltransferase involved in cell wall biosynthesis